jgi:DNA-binding transcriptional regulator YiaG
MKNTAHRGSRQEFTPKELTRMAERLAEGVTQAVTAEMFGTSVKVLRSVLGVVKASRRTRRLASPEEVVAIRELYGRGSPISVIAHRLKVPRGTVEEVIQPGSGCLR